MHCVKLLSCSYPKLNHYSFLVISKSIRPPFFMCENVLSFLTVTERGSVWLGEGLEGCPYHLLLPFASLLRLHSCIYSWKKNGKCVRRQILAFKAERENWEEVLQEFIPLPACSSWWCWVWAQCALCHCPKNHLDGCQHPFSCMGTRGHPGFGSWWKQTFSLRAKCGPVLCKHTGIWALFIPLALAATLSSPVGGCSTEFVSSFLLFVLNMLLSIPLDYSFCITRNKDYLFPFLCLCHRWCFTPPTSCVPHLNV